MKNKTLKRGKSFMNMKWMISAFVVSLILFFAVNVHAEEPAREQCTMTIEAGKHTFENPADADGACNGLVFGYYVPSTNSFHIIGSATYQVSYSGQQFEIPNPHYDYSPILTVYTIKKEPQPQEEKPEKPKGGSGSSGGSKSGSGGSTKSGSGGGSKSGPGDESKSGSGDGSKTGSSSGSKSGSGGISKSGTSTGSKSSIGSKSESGGTTGSKPSIGSQSSSSTASASGTKTNTSTSNQGSAKESKPNDSSNEDKSNIIDVNEEPNPSVETAEKDNALNADTDLGATDKTNTKNSPSFIIWILVAIVTLTAVGIVVWFRKKKGE